MTATLLKIDLKSPGGEIVSLQTLKKMFAQSKGLDLLSIDLSIENKILDDNETIAGLSIQEGQLISVSLVKNNIDDEPPHQKPLTSIGQRTFSKLKSQRVAPKILGKEIPQDNSLFEEEKHDYSGISELTKMGFPKEIATQALRSANNNIERAVDFILNGFPVINDSTTHSNLRFDSLEAESGDIDEMDEKKPNPLGFLIYDEAFQELKSSYQKNPAMVDSLVEQWTKNNSHLAEKIKQNYESLLNLLKIEDSKGEQQPMMNMPFKKESQNDIGNDIKLDLDQKEIAAINRLLDLGFCRKDIIEAFTVCEKNEELAASLLFDLAMNGEIKNKNVPKGVKTKSRVPPKNQVKSVLPPPDDDNIFR